MNFTNNRSDPNSANLIDISKFAESFNLSNILPNIPFSSGSDARKIEILHIMNSDIDDEYFEKLIKYCEDDEESENTKSSKNLIVTSKNTKKLMQNKSKFKTLKILKDRVVAKSTENIKIVSNRNSNITIEPMLDIGEPDAEPDLIPFKEVLIKIKVYRSVEKNNKKHYVRAGSLSHELIVLGSHTLDVLSDKIKCLNNVRVVADMSNNPDAENVPLVKDIYKSGFLFIDNTFYIDTRHPNNIDYSECIRKWTKNKQTFPEFKTAIMQETTFNSLKVNFGQPQVYAHLGSCEHVFVFADIEILKPSDVCYSSRYPYCKSLLFTKSSLCNICGLFMSEWIVTNSDRVPFDPAYFCESCFHSYNYVNGEKIGNFNAYRFVDYDIM